MTQLDLFADPWPTIAKAPPPPPVVAPRAFAKQIAPGSGEAKAMFASLNAATERFLQSPEFRDMEAQWLAEAEADARTGLIAEFPEAAPADLERIRQLNAVPHPVNQCAPAMVEEPAAKLLRQALRAWNAFEPFAIRATGIARRIAAEACSPTVRRVHMAEALSYACCIWLDDPREVEPEPPAPARQEPLERVVAVDDAFYDGPICKAYSCDTIATSGTIRKPFSFEGVDWVNTGGLHAGRDRSGDYRKGYRLVADDGTATPYAKTDWDVMREHPLGSYHGMAVKQGGKAMRLLGPEVRFVRGGQPTQPSLLDTAPGPDCPF